MTRAKIKLVKTKNPRKVPKRLREISKPVVEVTPEILELIKKMIDIMHKNGGMGLAAIQANVPLRLMVARLGDEDIAFINPEIVKKSRKESLMAEGCLSFPGYWGDIGRPAEVVVRASLVSGDIVDVEADGIVSHAFQHEIDHMDGVVFFDHIEGGANGLRPDGDGSKA